MEKKPVVPLCWDDQVKQPTAKVISPRLQNNDQPRPVSYMYNHVSVASEELSPFIVHLYYSNF